MGFDLPAPAERRPAECIVTVGGREISHLYPFLAEVRVEHSRREAATGTLRFDSARDENGRYLVQDDPAIRPWQPIVVSAAFGGTVEEIVRGFIRQVHASYPEDLGATAVEVELQDASLAMDREHVRKVWGDDAPTGDATIVAEIARKHRLAVEPGVGGLAGLTLSQNTTDIRFLRERALANGYELVLDRGEIHFGPQRLAGAPQPTIRVYAGRDTHCLRFDVRADGHQPDTVAYDAAPAAGAQPIGRVIAPDAPLLGPQAARSDGLGLAPFVWRLDRPGTVDEAELTARARGLANELALKVRAEGELDGSLYGHVLRVGRTVGVDGIGGTLGGVYYVDAVTHAFSLAGYRQSFILLRNAYGDNLRAGTNVLAGVA